MPFIIGIFSFSIYLVNTILWAIPIICLSILKLIPITKWQKLITHFLDGCASNWVSLNTFNQRLTNNTQIEVNGLDDLSPKEWYMVVSNHQSWVDILVLQRVFDRKIPFLKFFLKRELIWVPILGITWWALDFPFMQRFSLAFLKKNPHLKGKDLETTKKACEKFRFKPVSVMNFVEGTRWTDHKHRQQKPPFSHLLKPKAGGMAFVLNAMDDQLHQLIDVTIVYPNGVPTFWEFISGQVSSVKVHVRTMPIENVPAKGYYEDNAIKREFHQWLNSLWQEKDDMIKHLKQDVEIGH